MKFSTFTPQDLSHGPHVSSSCGNCEDEVDIKKQQNICLLRFKTPVQKLMSPQGAEQRYWSNMPFLIIFVMIA